MNGVVVTSGGESSDENQENRFEVNDLEFCTTCGTILPLPTQDRTLMCRLCKKTFEIEEWNGRTITNKYIINVLSSSSNTSTQDEQSGKLTSGVDGAGLKSEDFMGTFVDRKCSKCGHEGMTYSTRQTRSADEGQTVFFACPKCKSQEIEYS